MGCGNIAAVHAAVLTELEQTELVGAADINFPKAEAFVQTHGGAAYASLEEMLEKEKPDVLHICTPHYLHVPMAEYALDRGIHVFMEKPPAISWEQLEQLKAADARSEAKLGLCFQNRYNPSFRAAKEFLAAGKAGEILGGRGIVTWNRSSAYYTESGWRGSLTTEGGGVLINQAVHTLDLLKDLLGKPDWVDASLANHHLKGIIEVEDTIEAHIRFGEKIGAFYATNGYCADLPPIIEICGTDARVRIEDREVSFLYKDGTVEKPHLEQPKPLGKSYWGSGHASCIGDFYCSLEENRSFALELPAVEESVRLMLGIYESAREHHIVSL